MQKKKSYDAKFRLKLEKKLSIFSIVFLATLIVEVLHIILQPQHLLLLLHRFFLILIQKTPHEIHIRIRVFGYFFIDFPIKRRHNRVHKARIRAYYRIIHSDWVLDIVQIIDIHFKALHKIRIKVLKANFLKEMFRVYLIVRCFGFAAEFMLDKIDEIHCYSEEVGLVLGTFWGILLNLFRKRRIYTQALTILSQRLRLIYNVDATFLIKVAFLYNRLEKRLMEIKRFNQKRGEVLIN